VLTKCSTGWDQLQPPSPVFPPDHWLASRAGKHEEHIQDLLLQNVRASQFQAAADDIRSFAPVVLRACRAGGDADQLEEQRMKLEGLVNMLDGLYQGLQGKSPFRVKARQPEVVIQAVRLSRMLRNNASMTLALDTAISVCVPPMLVPALREKLRSKDTRPPSTSTIQRAQVLLDATFMRYNQLENRFLDGSIKLLADSSSVHDHNWLMTEFRFVKFCHLIEVGQCVHYLIENPPRQHDVNRDEEEVESEPGAFDDAHVVGERMRLSRILLEIIEHHVQVLRMHMCISI
jgi:hypothetical protein